MFKTSIGPYGEDPAYGRPEAGHGIFVDFQRVYEVMREKIPIGRGQVGTVLRNEISPRQGPIRLREFTIMDFELFFDPDNPECPYLDEVKEDQLSIVTEKNRTGGNAEASQISTARAVDQGTIKSSWAAYFMALSKRFLSQLGIKTQYQRFFEKLPSERAHYSAQTFDHEVKLDRWGWVEVAGFAYRTDYDIRNHMIASGTDMRVFRPYQKPIEKTTTVVKPNYQRLRAIFGNEAGRVGGLLASADPKKLADSPVPVELDGFVVPRDCFNLNQVTVK